MNPTALIVIRAAGRDAHAHLAAAALRRAAPGARIELHTAQGAQDPLTEAEQAAGARVLVVGGADARFPAAEPLTLEAVLADPAGALQAGAAVASAQAGAAAGPLRIVGITSCPTGIAHTFMAEEGLRAAAAALGHAIKVETQGSVGAQNALTADDIAAADLVVIAADTQVNLDRFAGKRLLKASTKAAIHDGQALIRKAEQEATVHGGAQAASAASAAEPAKKERAGPYKHLMTGVSFMLPFVVAGGLLIALAFALGGIYVFEDAHRGTLGWTLYQIGANASFTLIVPVLSGYIAYSIADRPGIAPGMAGGMVAATIGAGFLGGLVSGFIAGYAVLWLSKTIKLGRNFEGLKPILILPLLGTLIVGLAMYYVLGQPVASLAGLTAWLRSLQGASSLLLGALLGGMMAVDMGGPINKAAYAFSTGLLASQVNAPMAAAMVGGMTPPLGIALAAWVFRNRFTPEEREGAKAAGVLGLSFITEGAIPFAAKDPLRVIPALVAGSALAGAISMVAGCELRVPHGGVFVLPIPNAVTNLGMYVVALVAGTLLTAALLGVFKRAQHVKP